MKILRENGGAAAIEMALVLPVYLLFVFGIFEFGWIFWQYNSMQYAASDAARCKAINPACDAEAVAVTRAVGIGLTRREIGVGDCTLVGVKGARVTIGHSPGLLTHYIPVLDVELNVDACYPNPNPAS